MTEVRHIGKVLGGDRVIGKLRSLPELDAAVQKGLPKETLLHVVRHIYSETADQRTMMYRVVPEATYSRRAAFLPLPMPRSGAGRRWRQP